MLKELHCLIHAWWNSGAMQWYMSALNIPNKLGKCQFLEETEKFLYVLNILHTKHVCLADVLTQIWRLSSPPQKNQSFKRTVNISD